MSHSLIAPSSASRWVNCPGSVQMVKQYPDTKSSESADEGTEAHDWSYKVLTGVAKPEDVPSDFIEGVMLYVNDVEKNRLDLKSYSEVKLAAPGIHLEFFGTSDFVAVSDQYAIIWDFKYGRVAVNPFENWQGIGYAAGVVTAYPNVKDIEIRIVQPRSPHASRRVQCWIISVEDLQPYFEKMRIAAAEALDSPESRLFAGMHCQYCPARHGCKALDEKALSYVDSAHKADRFDLDPLALSRELDELIVAESIIKYRRTALQAQAESNIRSGVSVPGWDIKHSAGRLNWDMGVDAVIALGEMFQKPLLKKSTITPTQAKALGIPDEVINNVASRSAGKAKLEKVNLKQKFQQGK